MLRVNSDGFAGTASSVLYISRPRTNDFSPSVAELTDTVTFCSFSPTAKWTVYGSSTVML